MHEKENGFEEENMAQQNIFYENENKMISCKLNIKTS